MPDIAPRVRHILILDDEPGIAKLLQLQFGLLSGRPADSVHCAASVPEGLALVARLRAGGEELHGCIVDYLLGGATGIDFLHALRAQDPGHFARMPKLMITGCSMHGELDAVAKMAVPLQLTVKAKPFNAREIVQFIEDGLRASFPDVL